MDIISLTISVAAFVFSIFTHFKYDKNLKKQQLELNEIKMAEERKRLKEEKHARIFVKTHWQNNNIMLTIENRGKAIARNVDVSLVPNLIMLNRIFPIELMNPEDIVGNSILMALDSPDRAEAIIKWEDEAGAHTRRQILTFT